MKTAYAYARVSSKEQEEKKNSIPEQFKRINNFSNSQDIVILKKFKDSSSAFHDNNRDDFAKMVELALVERPNYIILDDSSRFARTRQVAIDTKNKLRSYGIEILYASEPNIDTKTVAGFWLEGIQEIKNEATSREISFHTKKGMSGNLQNRDIETGWCYKNGGKPPFGYKTIQLLRGKDKRGKPLYKAIWEINEKTALIVRLIIVDMYTNKKMSYVAIRDYLNNNNIKNSTGGLWSTSTISSMLRTERLEQYNGTAFWNKENKQVKGIKYNERTNWVICHNAHPAIITDEELKKAIDRKKETQDIRYKPKSNSNYLLSGKNLEGDFLFVCANCGGHVIGHSNGHSTQSYTCGINRHKGGLACDTNWKTSKKWLEEKIIEKIQNDYTTPQKIDMKIKNLQKEINSINNNTMFEIDIKKKELCNVEKAIDNLLNSIKNGVNPELIVNEINKCKEDKYVLLEEIKFLEMNCKNKYNYSSEEIKKFFNNINKSFEVANTFEKKELLKTFIRKIVLDQKKHQISVEFYPDIFMVPIGGAISKQVCEKMTYLVSSSYIIRFIKFILL